MLLSCLLSEIFFPLGFLSVYNLRTDVLLKPSTWKLYFNATVMNPRRGADEYFWFVHWRSEFNARVNGTIIHNAEF